MDIDLNKFISEVRALLFHPRDFFKEVKKEKGFKSPFLYYATISLVGIVLSGLSFTVLRPLFKGLGMPTEDLNLAFLLPTWVLAYLLGLALSFVLAALLHLWILIFRGKGGYQKTYQLWVYGSTPSALINWLPFGGLIAFIYQLVLWIVGTQELHGLTKRRTIIIVIMYLFVLVLQLFLVVLGLYALDAVILGALNPQ